MNQILEFRKQKPALSIGNPSEKISLAVLHRWQPSVKLQQKQYGDGRTVTAVWGRLRYFTDARMWTQCTPQKLDVVAAVSSLYLDNLAS